MQTSLLLHANLEARIGISQAAFFPLVPGTRWLENIKAACEKEKAAIWRWRQEWIKLSDVQNVNKKDSYFDQHVTWWS